MKKNVVKLFNVIKSVLTVDDKHIPNINQLMLGDCLDEFEQDAYTRDFKIVVDSRWCDNDKYRHNVVYYIRCEIVDNCVEVTIDGKNPFMYAMIVDKAVVIWFNIDDKTVFDLDRTTMMLIDFRWNLGNMFIPELRKAFPSKTIKFNVMNDVYYKRKPIYVGKNVIIDEPGKVKPNADIKRIYDILLTRLIIKNYSSSSYSLYRNKGKNVSQ